MIYESLKRSFITLLSPDFALLLVKIILITLAAILLFLALLISSLNLFTSALLIKFFGTIGIFIISWFLWPSLAPIVVIFFEDKIADIVSREYGFINKMPDTVYTRQIIIYSIQSAALMLLANIILLPLYFVPLFNIVLYYLLNSYLLGKFFFVSVVGRFERIDKAKILQTKFSFVSLNIGFLAILISNIPILNLFTPAIILLLTNHFYFNSNSHN